MKDAGPLSVVMVIFIWAFLTCLGFALIYLGFPDEAFEFQGKGPQKGFWTMIYFSFEMMTTLGLGDFTPSTTALRIVATLEALTGFGVLTASVSSIVLVHPAVARLRTIARSASLLKRVSQRETLSGAPEKEEVLFHFACAVAQTRVDLIHFPIVYYFYSDDELASLPQGLLELTAMVERSSGAPEPGVRRMAATLDVALHDLAGVLAEDFLYCDPKDCREVYRAFARHHCPLEQVSAHPGPV
jgi:hypothetical protein